MYTVNSHVHSYFSVASYINEYIISRYSTYNEMATWLNLEQPAISIWSTGFVSESTSVSCYWWIMWQGNHYWKVSHRVFSFEDLWINSVAIKAISHILKQFLMSAKPWVLVCSVTTLHVVTISVYRPNKCGRQH